MLNKFVRNIIGDSVFCEHFRRFANKASFENEISIYKGVSIFKHTDWFSLLIL